jgi:hypothetical protein
MPTFAAASFVVRGSEVIIIKLSVSFTSVNSFCRIPSTKRKSRTRNPGRELTSLKAHDADMRKRAKNAGQPPARQSKLLNLSDDELQLLDRPEIPLEQWNKGQRLLGSKLERLTIQRVGRQIANNPLTKKIKADKAELRKLIANNPQLVNDFEFFTKQLRWDPEGLLQHLYWDCNMMRATPQTVLAKAKKRTWPIHPTWLNALRDDISALADRLEQLNETEFSPARTAILQANTCERLSPVLQRHVLKIFRELPEILRLYSEELNRKVLNTSKYWLRAEKDRETLVDGAKRDSIYEKIRAKTTKYHAVRLHRLVNAARRIQQLPHLELRAFVIWLNRLKTYCEQAKRQAADTPRESDSDPTLKVIHTPTQA